MLSELWPHCRVGRRRLSHHQEEFGQIPGDQQHEVNSDQGLWLGWVSAPATAPSPLTQTGEDLAQHTHTEVWRIITPSLAGGA